MTAGVSSSHPARVAVRTGRNSPETWSDTVCSGSIARINAGICTFLQTTAGDKVCFGSGTKVKIPGFIGTNKARKHPDLSSKTLGMVATNATVWRRLAELSPPSPPPPDDELSSIACNQNYVTSTPAEGT